MSLKNVVLKSIWPISYGYQLQNFFIYLWYRIRTANKLEKHSVSVLFGFWTLSIIVKTHT